MCSVADIEPMEGKKASKRRSKGKVRGVGKGQCMKCSEAAVLLIRNADPLCKECFLEYVVHKFRATIGKARVIRQGERVLLAVSGGSSSCAMLDLVVRGLSKETQRKLRFQPGIAHIDEGELLGRSEDERKATWEHIKILADKVGFPCHLVRLEEVFRRKSGLACLGENLRSLDICDDLSKASSSLELFKNIATTTAKEDLMSHIYRWQLLMIAKEHGYDRVMVGDCSTSLSVRILSDVAQGRGSQLPFNIGFEDNRSEISVLRPMREFTKKEIEFHNCFNQVTSFSIPSFSTKASPHASVNRLTQEFVFGLQAAFPSTVSTIVRTGDKLSSDIGASHSDNCSLCLAPLEVGSYAGEVNKPGSCGDGQNSKPIDCYENTQVYGGGKTVGGDGDGDAITCSSNDGCCGASVGGNGGCHGTGDSSIGGDNSDHDGCCNALAGGKSGSDGFCGIGGTSGDDGDSGGATGIDGGCCGDAGNVSGNGQSCCGKKNKRECFENQCDDHLSQISNTLCYGCQLTYNELGHGQILLPKFVTDNASKTLRRTMMKEEIKDYLIDD